MNATKIGQKGERKVIKYLNRNRIKAVLAPNGIMKGIDGLIIKDKYTTWPIQIKTRNDLYDGDYIPKIKTFYSMFFIIAYSMKQRDICY